MPIAYQFALREAPSDVANMKFLGTSSIQQVELDYELAAGAALAAIDSFISPAPLPNSAGWQAGDYALSLLVANAESVSFTAELWRADKLGNLIDQIGSTPALQTAGEAIPAAPESVIFSIAGGELLTNVTDRLVVQLLAQNNDSVNAQEFSIMASGSSLASPIFAQNQATNNFNSARRGKFLGFVFRPGDGAGYFDKNGVDLVQQANGW